MKKIIHIVALVCILSISVFSAGIMVGGGFNSCPHTIVECHICEFATIPDPMCDQGGDRPAMADEQPVFGGELIQAFLLETHTWVDDLIIN